MRMLAVRGELVVSSVCTSSFSVRERPSIQGTSGPCILQISCDACFDGALASASRQESILPRHPNQASGLWLPGLCSELFLLLVYPPFYDAWSSEKTLQGAFVSPCRSNARYTSKDRVVPCCLLSCWPHITAFKLRLHRVLSYGHLKIIEEVRLGIWLIR